MFELIESATLLFVLLNPFLLIIYLVDLLQKYTVARYLKTLGQAGIIAVLVFITFSLVGDRIFSDVIHANFASFQIFGGIILFIIGIQFVFQGNNAINLLRGESANPAGSIAMPILIGPGTISASVIIGQNHPPLQAAIVITVAVTASILIMVLLKMLHDFVKKEKEHLVEGYIEVVGRITALYIGTLSIEMIMRGLSTWIKSGPPL